jgi:hypothetical protein
MKKKILLLISVIFLSINTSCVTNYYTVLLEEDTILYSSTNSESSIKVKIPKGTSVYLSPLVRKNSYRKIKWNNYSGWSSNTKYKYYSNYSSSSYKSNYSGGTVHVKGYYRKDGTYVRPHTRRAPRKRY